MRLADIRDWGGRGPRERLPRHQGEHVFALAVTDRVRVKVSLRKRCLTRMALTFHVTH